MFKKKKTQLILDISFMNHSAYFVFTSFFATRSVMRGPQTVMCQCASMKVHSTDKNNHEAITVRALHALLSRVTYSEQIGARCRAQGLLY